MTNVKKLPITSEQASFLNMYSEVSARLRASLMAQVSGDELRIHNLNRGIMLAPNPEVANEVTSNYARLDQLNQMIWLIFDTADEGVTHAVVSEYIALAAGQVATTDHQQSVSFTRPRFASDGTRVKTQQYYPAP